MMRINCLECGRTFIRRDDNDSAVRIVYIESCYKHESDPAYEEDEHEWMTE